jgi:tRNA (mo5U34)-methyltransferase
VHLKLKKEYAGRDAFLEEKVTEPNMLWIQSFDFGSYPIRHIEEAQEWRDSILPKDYTGKTVIDIGCANGYYSVAASQLGAEKVVAIDVDMRNFELSRNFVFEVFENNVQFLNENVLNLVQWDSDQFDIAIFMGVIYHMKNPQAGIEAVAHVLKPSGEMYLETLILPGETEKVALFLEDSEINNDPSNWWQPSENCVMAMMRTAGLTDVVKLSNYGTNRGYFFGRKI